MSSTRHKGLQYFTLSAIIVAAISNFIFLYSYGLHPDEAYYWIWSRQLSIGYFDNSPMIAYIIRLCTLIGQSEFWIRFPAFIGWLFFLLVVYKLTLKICQKYNIALLAVLIAVFSPLVATGSHIMTPDIPLIFLSSLSWYFLYLAVEKEQTWTWYIIGFLFGLALLAKLQAILFFGAVGAMILFRPSKWYLFRRKEPYIATFIGLLFFTPVLYWNWQHQWITFTFSFHHGIQHRIDFNNILEFLSGQAGVFSLLFLALIYYSIKSLINLRKISSDDRFLLGCFLPIFGFFTFTSLTYTALPNWPVIAYLPAIIFLAKQLFQSYQNARKLVRFLLLSFISFSFLISILLLTLVQNPNFYINTLKLKIPSSLIITNECYGWDHLARQLNALNRKEFTEKEQPIPLFSDGSFQTASEIQFYLKSNAMVFTMPQARYSQFDFIKLERIKSFDQQPGLLVLRYPLPDNANTYFQGIRLLKAVTVQRFHQEIRRFNIYRFTHLKAGPIYDAALNKSLSYH